MLTASVAYCHSKLAIDNATLKLKHVIEFQIAAAVLMGKTAICVTSKNEVRDCGEVDLAEVQAWVEYLGYKWARRFVNLTPYGSSFYCYDISWEPQAC